MFSSLKVWRDSLESPGRVGERISTQVCSCCDRSAGCDTVDRDVEDVATGDALDASRELTVVHLNESLIHSAEVGSDTEHTCRRWEGGRSRS